MSLSLTLALSLTLLAAEPAPEACTYDQDAQIQVLADLAKRVPGARMDARQKQLSWTGPAGDTRYSYGGCHDLGTRLTRTTAMATARTEAQVFELAKTLSADYLSANANSAGAVAALLGALTESRYTRHTEGDTTTYRVDHPEYIELSLTHRYAEGVDRVEIHWYINS